MGVNLENLYEQGPDAGLGSGGWAAWPPVTWMPRHPGTARYRLPLHLLEYGIFQQKIIDGWQTEQPDLWLALVARGVAHPRPI